MGGISWGDYIAIYAALISTYTAFRWLMEERPYLTVYQSDKPVDGGHIPIRVHNPGRTMIFVVGMKKGGKATDDLDSLIRVIPVGPPGNGITQEYAARLLSGILYIGIKPGGSEDFHIGPIYKKTDTVVSLKWHRNGQFDNLWPNWLSNIVNPLKIRVTSELEELVASGRTDTIRL